MSRDAHYTWRWNLRASPEALWPLASDTERFNRAVGLPEPTFTDTPRPDGGSDRRAELHRAGMLIQWDEHPFEWVAPRWFGVLRTYHSGPLKQLRLRVELAPSDDGGTDLTYEVQLQSAGLVGHVAQKMEFKRLQAEAERVFRRMDAQVLAGASAERWRPALDPFEAPRDHLTPRQAERLHQYTAELRTWRLPTPELVEQLAALIRYAPDHQVERIRPLALARLWRADAEATLDLCLIAAHLGALELSWAILCPSCRATAEDAPSLARLAPTTHCDACNIDFETEFVRSVELSFRPAAAVRPITPATYCLGGPGRKPSAAAQLWLQPGETREVELQLTAGSWRISGPQLGEPAHITVATAPDVTNDSNAPHDPIESGERARPQDELHVELGSALTISGVALAGSSRVTLHNTSGADRVVRIEREAWRDDALTAAEAMTRSTFRQLFSADVLTPGVHVDVGFVAILFTDLQASTALYEQVGDAAAYAKVRRHFEVMEEVIVGRRGAVIKTIGDAVMAAWQDPLDAVIAALSLQSALAANAATSDLGVKVGVHWGRCIGVTINGIFDYFGTTVNTAARLERVASAGEVALSQALAHEPTVAAWLADRPALLERTTPQALKGLSGTHVCTVLSGRALGETALGETAP